MEAFEKEEHLRLKLGEVLEYHSKEYDMTLASVLGVLRLIEEELLGQNCQCDDCEDEETK